MKNDKDQVISAKIAEAHNIMMEGFSKMRFPADGIENKDDEKETALIEKWADYATLEKELSAK